MNEFGYSLDEYNREQLETLLRRYKRSLGSLVVGGSEYWNEPERCVTDIRQRIEGQENQLVKLYNQIRRIRNILVIGWIMRRILK